MFKVAEHNVRFCHSLCAFNVFCLHAVLYENFHSLKYLYDASLWVYLVVQYYDFAAKYVRVAKTY